MTHRETPDSRPERPGSGDTRLEAIERLRRQLDKLSAQGRGTGSGAVDTAPYGGREYARAEADDPNTKSGRTQRRSARGKRSATAGRNSSWGRREEALPGPSDTDEFSPETGEQFGSGAMGRSGSDDERFGSSADEWSGLGADESSGLGAGRWGFAPDPGEQTDSRTGEFSGAEAGERFDPDTGELDDSPTRRARANSARPPEVSDVEPRGGRTGSSDGRDTPPDAEFDDSSDRYARRGRRTDAGDEASFGESSGGSERRGRGRGRGRRRSGEGAEDSGGGLPGGGTEAQAKDVCLRLLGDRARSRAELADRLTTRGFSVEIANRALDRLTEVGLIDDAAFAEQWVHQRHTFSGKGKRALVQELRRKGVADEDAEPALAAITDDDEYERAAELVRRKLRTLPRDLDREKVLRRLVGMLARRGYNQSTAFTVVKAELADRDLTEPDSN